MNETRFDRIYSKSIMDRQSIIQLSDSQIQIEKCYVSQFNLVFMSSLRCSLSAQNSIFKNASNMNAYGLIFNLEDTVALLQLNQFEKL